MVEFDRVKGRSSEFVLKHVRAGQDVFIKEIESAGFRRITTAKPPALKENFFASFEKARLSGRREADPRQRTATAEPARPIVTWCDGLRGRWHSSEP